MEPSLRSRCGLLLSLLTCMVLLVPYARPLHADEAEDSLRLRLLGDPEHAEYATALAWWDARDLEEQVAILRRALASEDVGLATLAAEALGTEFLDNAEIRRQMRLLLTRPMAVFHAPSRRVAWGIGSDLRAWGSPDLVPFFRHAATDKTGAYEDLALDSWHRVLRVHHVEGLVPLLDARVANVFRSLLWHIAMCGEYDHEDRYREPVARGLLYGLKRMRAVRAGDPVPPMDAERVVVASPPGGGLPEAYVTLAQAYFPRKGEWKVRLDADGPPGDLDLRSTYFWLRRWARDLTPSARDLSYLKDLVEEAETADAMLLRWAMGHMAALPGADGLEQVKTWADGKDGKAAYAAAALAERGNAQRFYALCDLGDATPAGVSKGVRAVLRDLLWSVDRAAARERWVADRLLHDPPYLDEESGLDPNGRFEKAVFHGVDITVEDMAWIARALWERDAPTLTLAWFHGRVWPEGLTRDRTEILFERLHELDTLSWDDGVPGNPRPLLGLLEVRDEARLVGLLHRWIETQAPLRSELLQWLAMLGDTRHAAAMIEDWEEWEFHQRWMLGRVESEAVRRFLTAQAEGEDPELVLPAVVAQLIQAGLPEPCARELLITWDVGIDEGPVPEIRRLLRGGDTAAAVSRAAEHILPCLLGVLGSVGDDRVRVQLERVQADRHAGLYLGATIGLAIAGDAEAMRLIRSFLDDDRLWMIEDLADEVWSYLDEPWIVEHWVGRLDSNCCLGFRGMVALRSIYPTIPFEDGYGGAGTQWTRAWIESQRWKRSHLLDGLVPLAPE